MAIMTLFVTSALLTVLTAITLVKVWCGTGYKMILLMITLLLGSNISYMINCIGWYEVFKRLANDDSNTDSSLVAASFGQGFGDLCFCTGHWVLAFYYFNIAKNMPKTVRGVG